MSDQNQNALQVEDNDKPTQDADVDGEQAPEEIADKDSQAKTQDTNQAKDKNTDKQDEAKPSSDLNEIVSTQISKAITGTMFGAVQLAVGAYKLPGQAYNLVAGNKGSKQVQVNVANNHLNNNSMGGLAGTTGNTKSGLLGPDSEVVAQKQNNNKQATAEKSANNSNRLSPS